MSARASVVVEMSSDEARLLRGMQNVLEKERQLEAKRKDSAKAADDASKRQQKNLDDESNKVDNFIGRLGRLITQWVSVGVAINAVTTALQKQREEQDKAISGVERLADSRRRLRQVSGGDADTLNQLENIADEIATGQKTSLVNRVRARTLVFEAQSQGFLSSVRSMAEREPVLSVEAQSMVAGRAARLFGGEMVPVQQAMAGTFAAARRSPETFEAIAANLPRAAEGAARQGAEFAEATAALGVLAEKFATPETTAARLRAFGDRLARDERTAGRGLLGGAAAIEAMSEAERKKFIGSNAEVAAAYDRLLLMSPQISARTEQVRSAMGAAGTAQDPINMALRAAFEAESGAVLSSRMKALATEAQEEVDTEKELAVEGFARRQEMVDIRNLSRARGEMAMSRSLQEQAAEMGGDVGGVVGDRRFGMRAGAEGARMLGPDLMGPFGFLGDIWNDIRGNTKRIADQTRDRSNSSMQRSTTAQPQE